jgi:hypothetical protein
MVELMPDNYALAVGISNLSEPTSLLFWSWAPLPIANPNNVSPDIEITEYSRKAYYFGEAVTSRVPYLFYVMTMMATVFVFSPLLLIKNPPWLYSVVDKVFYGKVQRIELSPDISIRNSPARQSIAADPFELVPCAFTLDLEEMYNPDRNDSQNNEMDSGHKIPL